MSSTSRDLQYRLAVLREKMEHPTNYECALTYFGDEFATNHAFIAQSVRASTDGFDNLLAQCVTTIFGKPTRVDRLTVLHLPEFGFYHGAGIVGSRALMFCYFKQANTGVLTLIPGLDGRGSHVGRFRFVSEVGSPHLN